MISINDYIDCILEDFQDYVSDSDCLCELHDLRFDGGHIPDYSNLPVQQLYLLRYAYGYAFEYKQMFQSLAPQKWASDALVLTSIGCGTMLDYWAARKPWITLDIVIFPFKSCVIFFVPQITHERPFLHFVG